MIELLRLTAPEIIVALAGLLVLVVDIGLLRRTALALRVSIAVAVAILGCVIAFANIHTLGVLPAGLLVVTPLTLPVQRALLVLSILVLALCTSARFTRHAGEYCALILFATTADDVAGEHAKPAGDLPYHRIPKFVLVRAGGL